MMPLPRHRVFTMPAVDFDDVSRRGKRIELTDEAKAMFPTMAKRGAKGTVVGAGKLTTSWRVRFDGRKYAISIAKRFCRVIGDV
jgi:hypothetical protein